MNGLKIKQNYNHCAFMGPTLHSDYHYTSEYETLFVSKLVTPWIDFSACVNMAYLITNYQLARPKLKFFSENNLHYIS